MVIRVKGQTNGANGGPENAGPVSKAIGTIGSPEPSFKESGAAVVSGGDSITTDYTDVYIIFRQPEHGVRAAFFLK